MWFFKFQDEETQVHGIVSIGDFGEMGMTHVINMDRKFAKLMNSLMQVGVLNNTIIYIVYNV